MFVPDLFYVYTPEQWAAQTFEKLRCTAGYTTHNSETARLKADEGKIIAHRSHGQYVRVVPVTAWEERYSR